MQLATTELFNGNGVLPNGVSSASITAVDGSSNVKTNGLQVSTSGASATSLTYDLNGNMTSDGANSYAWDAENRMIKITYPGTGNYSAFSYDGQGKYASIIETTSGSMTSTKEFVWCGEINSEARSSSGPVTAQYFSMGQSMSGVNYFYDLDHLGSTREMLDTSANIKAQYNFDPFGRITLLSNNVPSDFQYAGYYSLGRSGLSQTRTRAYSSQAGRFINRDYILEAGGSNLFAYVGNAPSMIRDPLGTKGYGSIGGFTAASGLDASGLGNGCRDVVNSVIGLPSGAYPDRDVPPGSTVCWVGKEGALDKARNRCCDGQSKSAGSGYFRTA